jgi:integrase
MGKRANGEGTVFERKDRPGSFRGEFTYRNPDTGEVDTKKFNGKSRKEVLAAGKVWLDARESGLVSSANTITLGEWIDRWLADYAKPRVRIKTYEKYEGGLRLYIKPRLGAVRLAALREPDITRVFNTLVESGSAKVDKRGNHIGLAPITVKNVRRALCMCLDQAVKSGLLRRNVAKDTKAPKVEKQQVKALTAEQAKALVKAAKEWNETVHIAILLALSTGMRRGELFGLHWQEVDLKNGTVTVNQSVTTAGGKIIWTKPKTESSNRKIPLPPDVVAELKKFKLWQTEQRLKMGDKWENTGIVVANMFGRVTHPTSFHSGYFKPLLKKAGIPNDVKFHDLRHTHATLLLQQGVNVKVVAERLGHSKATMTMDVYSHVMPDMQEAAVQALAGMFGE